jgi:hypothetical protein
MDTDKIKIFGARVRVDGTGKLAELEWAEKVCPLTVPAHRAPCSFQIIGLDPDYASANADTHRKR